MESKTLNLYFSQSKHIKSWNVFTLLLPSDSVCTSMTRSPLSIWYYVCVQNRTSHWYRRNIPSPSISQGWEGLMQHPFKLHLLSLLGIIFSIIAIWYLSFCAWTRSVWSISAFMACGLDFSSSFTPPPLPPLFSYPVVQRGQVNEGRHDDRWPLQSEGLYINTKQLRFSCTPKHRCIHPLT